MLESFGCSDPGCVRSNNEDYFLLAPRLGLYIVADGMGGAQAGEHASKLATETVAEYIFNNDGSGKSQAELLVEAFDLANRRVMEAASEDAALEGMGTTLVAAGLPVLFGSFLEGLPGAYTLSGFAFALLAVWLVSGGGNAAVQADKLWMPALSGFCFAAFFIFLDRGSGQSILWPLAATRVSSISSLLTFSLLARQPWIPTRESWLLILLSSLLDSAGNALYALSARMGRMDVAAVLGSLYPGSTVLLAWFVLKERVSPLQMIGIALALIAIVLITL